MSTSPSPAPHPGVGDREGYIGGSDASAILSLSPYASPFAVFCAKRGIEVPRGADAAREERFEFGHLLEPVIAAAFSKRYSIPLRRAREPFYRGKVRKFMGGHLDFEVDDDSRAFVECKNVENEFRGDWDAPPESLEEDASSCVPLYYLAQCDHYIDLTNAPHCFLVALFGGCKLRAYRIERDEKRIKLLTEAERIFWKRVTDDDPPPFSGVDDLLTALRAGYIESYTSERAKKEKRTVQLDGVAAELLSRAYAARQQAKRAKKEADVAKDALLVHLEGQTGYLQVGGERYGSFLVQERDSFDDEALKIAYPDMYAKFKRKLVYGPVLRLTKNRAALEEAGGDDEGDD